jgi:ligand-binding sensor domain-containing protein
MGRICGWPKDWTSGLGQGWVATLSGFYAQQNRGWKIFTPKPALQGVTVTGVARFRQQFWLASQNGVYCLDPVSGGCQQVLAELPDSWVTCLESFHGQLWAGTFRDGLCHFDGRKWSREERPGPRIHCLLATAAGLWIGTPRGLMWTDGRTWRTYDRAQGLPSNAVWSLAARGDQLWIGTDSGLCQASLRALTQTAHEVGFDRPL